MNKLYLLVYILLMVSVAYAVDVEECAPEMEPINIPCQITTSWQLPDPCSTYTVSIYNDSSDLIGSSSLSNFTPFCYFMFNYTQPASYYYEFSFGDSGQVEVLYEMELLQGILVYGLYLFVVLALLVMIHKFRDDQGTPIVYGILASVLSYIMVAVLLSGFEIIKGVSFIIDVNYYFIAFTTAIGLYTTAISITFFRDIRDARRPQEPI